MFEPQDNGDSIELLTASLIITALLGVIVLQLHWIKRTLEATPKEFIQQFDNYRETELNP